MGRLLGILCATREPNIRFAALLDPQPGPTALPGPSSIPDSVPGPSSAPDPVPGPSSAPDPVPSPELVHPPTALLPTPLEAAAPSSAFLSDSDPGEGSFHGFAHLPSPVSSPSGDGCGVAGVECGVAGVE